MEIYPRVSKLIIIRLPRRHTESNGKYNKMKQSTQIKVEKKVLINSIKLIENSNPFAFWSEIVNYEKL